MMAETKAYNEVFNYRYLHDNEYSIYFSKDQKRNLHKKALKYVLEDGALFFIDQRKGEPKRWVHSTYTWVKNWDQTKFRTN